jgi:PAS domain-containing protein
MTLTPPISTTPDVDQLLKQLERTQAAYVSTLMEKNFLQRAMADLNFHHNAHDGIVYTNAEGQVVYANPYFLKMMNVENPDDILNKPLPDYMWLNSDDASKLFADVREFGFVRERELNLYNRDKSAVFVACSAVASKDPDGNFVGTEIMLCNVTTKKKVQAELGQRTAQLERITEFCRHSIDNLDELIKRGAERAELAVLIKEIKAEFAKISDK